MGQPFSHCHAFVARTRLYLTHGGESNIIQRRNQQSSTRSHPRQVQTEAAHTGLWIHTAWDLPQVWGCLLPLCFFTQGFSLAAVLSVPRWADDPRSPTERTASQQTLLPHLSAWLEPWSLSPVPGAPRPRSPPASPGTRSGRGCWCLPPACGVQHGICTEGSHHARGGQERLLPAETPQ